MKTIGDRWLLFRERVIHPDAPDLQVSEMRIAFYAGCKSMLDACRILANVDAASAFMELERFRAEARRFGEALERQHQGEHE